MIVTKVIDELEETVKASISIDKKILKLINVARAAEDFYLNHEHLGWGGHEGMGKALAALEEKS